MFHGNKVLVIAAHPDDEILGCGATMARFASEGKTVQSLILAEGLTSRDKTRDIKGKSSELEELYKRAELANARVGSLKPIIKSFPDNRMDSIDLLDVVKEIELEIQRFKPDIILTHNHSDVNIDHSIVHRAVVTACRPQPGFGVRSLLFFEVQSSTEWSVDGRNHFSPTIWVDCSNFMDKKMAALEAYASEMRPWPHARSYEAVASLMKWRGSNIGANYAESFMLGRQIY